MKIKRSTVYPQIVSALEYFPPLNSFRTFMYCDQRLHGFFQAQKNHVKGGVPVLWSMVPQVQLFSFVFWKNWRHQKDILKLTDLYYIPCWVWGDWSKNLHFPWSFFIWAQFIRARSFVSLETRYTINVMGGQPHILYQKSGIQRPLFSPPANYKQKICEIVKQCCEHVMGVQSHILYQKSGIQRSLFSSKSKLFLKGIHNFMCIFHFFFIIVSATFFNRTAK